MFISASDVERGLKNQVSTYTNSYTRSNVVDTGIAITTTTSAATNATFTTRRKSTYNPYAPANRRRHIAATSLSSLPANPSRTISPVTGPTTLESTGSNNSHITSRERDRCENLQDRQQVAGMTITTTAPQAPHQQFPNRSGRVRSSRHFGVTGSPFRAPGASLLSTTTNLDIVGQNKISREIDNNNAYGDSLSDDSSQYVNGQKRRNSLMLQELEDTDDDDDSVWLNAPPTFSSSTKRKRN